MDCRRLIKLLVVHEQANYCNSIRELAEMNQHLYDVHCEFTHSGREAMELIGSWQPSIVLLDAHISDMNSFKMVAECRESGTPIIVTSTYNSPEIETSAREHGAIGYCQTSNDPEILESILQQIVEFSSDLSHFH